MAAYYGDSSALVKRYVQEAGSAWMTELTLSSAGNAIITALVSGPEIVAALTRRRRTGLNVTTYAAMTPSSWPAHLLPATGLLPAVYPR